MKIKELFLLGRQTLQDLPTPELDTRVLLCHFLKCNEAYLITHEEDEVLNEKEAHIKEAFKKRKEHYPVAYITGEKEFFRRSFEVNENVLIPRPETEELIESVLNVILNEAKRNEESLEPRFFANAQNDMRILDLGTGSGCIAITLKKELPEVKIFAGDISKSALEVAKRNAKKHNANITFFQTDLLNSSFFIDHSSFSIVIANLPYVHETERHSSIQHEPNSALFSGIDGLDHYRRLAEQLKKNPCCKILVLEIDNRQANEIKKIYSFAKKIETLKDLAGKERIVIIRFN